MQIIQQNPDMVSYEEVTPFSAGVKDAMTEMVSPELADQISTINLAVSNGVVSKARAAKTVLSNPVLTAAMMKLGQAGVITFGL